MIVYHSAFQMKEEYFEYLGELRPRILRSFYGNKSTELPNWCSGMFLDSGAFSVFNSGAVIKIEDYMQFLKENGMAFDAYAGLDVIGNEKATKVNQQILDKEGLKAIPTYHMNESKKMLIHYAKTYDYIALGGMVGGTKQALQAWLDIVWTQLKNYPEIKVHGFGLTDLTLARRYPWYSIDSTTASRAGRVGVLITPWGQLRVSSGIKTRTNSSIYTEKLIEKVLGWVNLEMSDLDISWDDLHSPSARSSQIRSIINAIYIESVVQKPLKIKKKIVNRFNL